MTHEDDIARAQRLVSEALILVRELREIAGAPAPDPFSTALARLRARADALATEAAHA